MKTKILPLLAGLLILASCGGNAQKDEPDPAPAEDIKTARPTIQKDLTISSTALKMTIKYSVWLPPTYDPAKKYPVLYLLHGYEYDTTDAHNKWLSTDYYGSSVNGGNLSSIATRYVRDGGELFIIVTPNGHNAFYQNNEGGLQYETFFIDEFIPYIEKKYNANGKRAIAGLSMGGYGTLYNGYKHPEMFTYLYAMSPATGAGAKAALASCDVKKAPPCTIETGTDDMTVSLASVQDFVKFANERGFKPEFITRAGGHTWQFWQECLPKALVKVGESFK